MSTLVKVLRRAGYSIGASAIVVSATNMPWLLGIAAKPSDDLLCARGIYDLCALLVAGICFAVSHDMDRYK